jgi:putative acetyltransferase
VDVRFERAHDRGDVRRVYLDAFGEYGEVVASLLDDLRTGDELSLVAEEEDAIVGHAMFTPSLLDAPRRLVAVEVLSPVGVVHRRQKQGVGSALVRRGLELLVERGVPVVFVRGPAGLLLAIRFRTGRRAGLQETVVADPGRGVPGAPAPGL